MLFALAAVLLLALAAALFYFTHPVFGSAPRGERLARITRSPNYRDGSFQNQIETPMLTTDESRLSLMFRNFSGKRAETRPPRPLPTIKTDLRALDRSEDLILWLGHSSFYVQLGGLRILVDPIFSDYAAPFSWANRAFAGTLVYTAEDMPEIDLLVITHDHYDHLDYPTARALRAKARKIVAPLGVGAHLERWGYESDRVAELDWGDSYRAAPDGVTAVGEAATAVEVIATSGRHFSGRTFKRSQTLWMGLILRSAQRQLFFSGDTGYGPHFAEIGARHGPFDWVSLDSGQYNDRWRHMHMRPEESAQAAQELGARAFTPGHVGRFTLSDHDWDDPFRRIAAASAERPYALWTPLIGQPMYLDGRAQHFGPWWEALRAPAAAAAE
ncbi:MBL fold metallo-hydrolase [Cephaloticoccus primus]|uniref:MBL fold metallo-hydrolase n=2 Tax=Cephaloticoccus primus TaxID=1548207 RepID=A0A139ST59_9BACT|nr:MBL fold metallo-hydrolase [Cephaloticoccus primus]